ncbi:MAG: bifunctional folylpolyglutamate synthase/dihydrofolate synthase [Desulfobacteraceae bacterium]|nr:bifunctional folylpolyglutamate synthase/dihydrofolate synthase [Desulfobacteraceae bacterium]
MSLKNNSYESAIRYLNSFQFHGFRLGLDRMASILSALKGPQASYPCVHVAGTNGKGSVCATIASILVEADYKTGLYTSPHLVSVEERFSINGRYISKEDITRLIFKIKTFVDAGYELSYFEYTTVLAMEWFRQEGVDIAVFETGLGGRLDATNVVTPIVSVITNVSFDHQSFLGKSLESIAGEKAGIIKPGVPVISGVADGPARSVIIEKCRQAGAPLRELGMDFCVMRAPCGGLWDYRGPGLEVKGISLRLLGAHQALNMALSVAACEVLAEKGFALRAEAIREGIKRVSWPCRAEFFKGSCLALIDGAHNIAGVYALRDFLAAFCVGNTPFPTSTLLWACSNEGKDKDFASMLNELAAFFERVIITEPPGPRHPVTIEDWRAAGFGGASLSEKDWQAAFESATAKTKGGFLCVAGSLYLCGAVRQRLVQDGFRPASRPIIEDVED